VLKKLSFKSGINRENTRYTTEGGYYDGDKIRFRQGTPEVIGGWVKYSTTFFQGVCRSLWNWVTLSRQNLIAVGTNLKYYINKGGAYYDITPIRYATTLSGPFTATTGLSIITVHNVGHGCVTNDFVTFNGASSLGGTITAALLNQEYQVTVVDEDNYTINVDVNANSSDTGHGGSVRAVYQINTGSDIQIPQTGWGAGPWGYGTWGYGIPSSTGIRLWSQSNYGQNLIFGPRGGAMYYFDTFSNTSTVKVTISNATPAVIQFPLQTPYINEGTTVYLETTGDLPSPLATGTIYYLRNFDSTTYTCNISATVNGVLINTTTSGSGNQYINPRGINIAQLAGADVDTPTIQNYIFVSDIYRFVFAFGCDDYTTQLQVLISNAAPGVVSFPVYTNYIPDGTVIFLTTTGTLPAPLDSNVPYYVRNFDTATWTCNLSYTTTGSLITTTTAGSGIHTANIKSAQDPLLMRWSNQEDYLTWTPSATNQAGSLRLSHGSQIVTAIQTRQEMFVLTDSAGYSVQYLGAPYVWNAQLMVDNISIVGQNAVALASGVIYWMGVDKFYKYDGRAQTLRCDLKAYIFNDFNKLQSAQVYAGTNEGFNEVWWFYCSANSTVIDKYVVYNYVEDIWYYGTMGRTAWLDSGILDYPIAATYSNNIVYHENGLNDYEGDSALPINAYITTSEFDIDDGHNFAFIRRILPDLTFRGSTADAPTATMSVIPLNNSGSGYTDPASVGGADNAAIVRTATVPIEAFTGQVFIRVRGRQFAFKIESNQLDTVWQLGSPRIDYQLDGRRST